jgi:hypothetical protein
MTSFPPWPPSVADFIVHSTVVDRCAGLLHLTDCSQPEKALFRRTAELLGEGPRHQAVFVTVLEAAKENWSVGHGLAQFA